MSTLTMNLQVWGKMPYLPILVAKFSGKIWHQNMQKGGEVQGETPVEWTYLLLGRKLCQYWMWVVKVDIREREGNVSMWNILSNRICIFVPFFSWVEELDGGRGYCKQRAGMSCSTLSQVWGSWHLPRFLFKRQIIDPHEHSFFDGSGEAFWLPAHYGEVV